MLALIVYKLKKKKKKKKLLTTKIQCVRARPVARTHTLHTGTCHWNMVNVVSVLPRHELYKLNVV